MDMIDAIRDPNLLGAAFRNLETWNSWIVCLKAIFGLPLNADEFCFFQACTGRQESPHKPFKEVYLIVGRRGGNHSSPHRSPFSRGLSRLFRFPRSGRTRNDSGHRDGSPSGSHHFEIHQGHFGHSNVRVPDRT